MVYIYSLRSVSNCVDSVVTSCGVFMVKLAKRGGGLGISVRGKLLMV